MNNTIKKEDKYEQKGTPFQQAVWAELLKIEKGKTVTYKELAQRIGKPKAVRAVASAVAKNRLLIIVPCHRVVKIESDFFEV